MFGTGVQARSQADYALRVLPHIATLRYVSVDRKRDERFEQHFAGRLQVQCAADADDAVAHSDVVITATPGGGPLFCADAVRPGTHINCVGADTKGKREMPEGLLPRARVVVDDLVQSRQIGELQWAPQTTCVELGALLTGKAGLERAVQASASPGPGKRAFRRMQNALPGLEGRFVSFCHRESWTVFSRADSACGSRHDMRTCFV